MKHTRPLCYFSNATEHATAQGQRQSASSYYTVPALALFVQCLGAATEHAFCAATEHNCYRAQVSLQALRATMRVLHF